MILPVWIEQAGDAWLVRVRLQPGARKSGVVGEHGDRLKIAVQAPPVDGKANAALVQFVSECLSVSRSNVTLVSGHSSRDKRIRIEKTKGLTDEFICQSFLS